jgi:hypothetical protein
METFPVTPNTPAVDPPPAIDEPRRHPIHEPIPSEPIHAPLPSEPNPGGPSNPDVPRII